MPPAIGAVPHQETAGVSPLYAALAINGRPVALTERNGEWLRWLAD